MVLSSPCGDLDGLLAGLERDRLAVVLVPAAAVQLLQVQVGDVGAEVRHAPGDVLVVADDHAGHPGERVAGDVVLARGRQAPAVQAHLVPDGRELRRQVRVVGEQRLPGDGVRSGDHPRVGADAVAVRADGRGDLVQGVGEPGQLALEAVGGLGVAGETGACGAFRAGTGAGGGTRSGARARTRAGLISGPAGARPVGAGRAVVGARLDDRLVPVVRVVRIQVRDLLRAEAARHQGAVDLFLHVAAQVPRHRLEPGHGVGRLSTSAARSRW